jgi:hypothetical protein
MSKTRRSLAEGISVLRRTKPAPATDHAASQADGARAPARAD